jgi:hypothetical protein
MAKNLIDIWFVTDPGSETVEQILMLGPLGMSGREDGNWVYISRATADASGITEKVIYTYDWSSDTTEVPDDYSEFDLMPFLSKFDEGSLTVSDLEDISSIVYDGTDQE